MVSTVVVGDAYVILVGVGASEDEGLDDLEFVLDGEVLLWHNSQYVCVYGDVVSKMVHGPPPGSGRT